MGSEPGAEAMELKVLVTVRDRLHLAEVMRNLRRSSAVLRATRSKA
jgi:GTP pyrophosphokinase/guanosine-3',5'-bis(diphosphate) 3'-pyrophosphohydrolase